jgi:membrane-associated HD superfamily phosphohydrolase
MKWLLTVILAVLAVPPAFGQPYRVDIVAMLQKGVDTPALLAAPTVIKEIKLTDEQAETFRKIVKEVYSKPQADVQKTMQQAQDEVNKAIPNVLRAEQAKRLKQIELQVNGILSFSKPEVQKKLKLSDKQKDEIKHLNDGLKKDIRKLIEGAAKTTVSKRVEALGKVPELKNDAARNAVKVLDDEQQKTWKEMTGEKFELLKRAGGPSSK